MHDHSLFMRTLSEFSSKLLTSYDLDVVLGELMERLRDVLGLEGSGVALARDGRLEFTTTLPHSLAELEFVQIEHQAGPCVDAYRTGEVTVAEDLGTQHARWPRYCAVAERLGVRSVVGIPMRLNQTSVGAVNLYARRSRDWSRDDLDAAVVMADMATSYLVNASELRQQEQLTEQLQQALDTKAVIEQAKGVVANEHHTSVEQAFQLIRGHARHHHVTVRSIAEAIVQLGLKI